MELTDIPDDAYDGEESPPDFEARSSIESLTDAPIRERLLDVVVGVRTPTKVSTIAARADCDTETARDYLAWFEEMGMVSRQDGRPVRYERNDRYFQWRRVETIRAEYTDKEILDALSETLDRIEALSSQFDAARPEAVSLVEATREQDLSTEHAWELLSEWETLERRAALLDAARQTDPFATDRQRAVDA